MKNRKSSFILFIITFAIIVFGTAMNNTTVLAETTDSSDMTFNGFKYSIAEDSSITITGYSGSEKEVVIPSQIDRKPVTRIGGKAFYSASEITSIIIPDGVTCIEDAYHWDEDVFRAAFGQCTNLTNISIPNSIISIGRYAFDGCTKLTEITIPDNVTTIGHGIFRGCSSLTQVTLPNNFTCGENSERDIKSLFYNCTSLAEVTVSLGNGNFSSQDGVLLDNDKTKIFYFPSAKKGSYTIPDSVNTIGESIFSGCTGLTNITIPDSITTIGESAFSCCTGLTNITIPDSVTTIESYAFQYCTELIQITLSNHLTKIGRSAFSGCSKLPDIVIPDSVTHIGEMEDNGIWYPDEGGTFNGCSYLTDITLSANIEYIAPYTFYNCSRLKTVTIPDSVTSIGESAFSNSGLTSITIPGKVTDIGYQAFSDCNLVNLTVLDGVTVLGDSAFKNCDHLTNVTLPQTLKTIGYDTFKKCGKLKTLSIPDTVTRIGSGAFEECIGLTSVNIPLGISGIEYSTFNKCESLTTIVIPNNVTYIGSDQSASEYKPGTGAFANCKNLVNISLPDTLEIIGYETFYNCNNLSEITIPNSVTTIGFKAFYSSGLTNITLSNSLIKIREYTFSECNRLKKIIIPDSVTTIEKGAFSNTELREITLSKNIKCIEGLAFDGCSLRTLELPDSLTEIKAHAFEHSGLIVVTIPDSVTDIGDEAFSNCPLSSVIIYPCVTRMGFAVFSNSGLYNEPIDIYYMGTKDDWQKIICPYFDENASSGVEIHYNNTFPTQITLNAPLEITLTYGSTHALSATITPSNATAQKIIWIADIGGIVQLSRDGTLTAMGESLGTTTVTAMTANGIPSTSINVTIIPNAGEHMHAEAINEGFPATCTSDGYTDGAYCSDCGIVLIKQEIIPATGHQWGTWTTVKLPTPTIEGEKVRLCAVCNETEHQTIPKTGTVTESPATKPQILASPTVQPSTVSSLPQVKKATAKNKKKKAVTLSWKKIKNATWYEIQYSTNKKFKSCKIYKAKKTTATIKKLKKRKTYYFRIRACKMDGKKKVYGKWSSVKKVKIKK